MKTGLAILFSLGLLILALVLSGITKFNFVILLVLLTAVWAAWDSSKIELKKYKSGISYGPVVVFICHIGLWIVAFPWYLSMRYKIKNWFSAIEIITSYYIAK